MDAIEQLGKKARELGCLVRFQEPMKRHTTFHIGGPADLFCTAHTAEALAAFLKEAAALDIPVLPLGNGSNMLVSDTGIRGAVLTLDGDFTKIRLAEPNVISCGSAASLAGLCKFAQAHALKGLEFAWGIPGSSGGAAYMNAGAYGGEMINVITRCSHVQRDGTMGKIEGEALHFGYRHSVYMENGAVITGIEVKLTPGDADQIELTMEDYYNRRKTKQPLNKPSAGSVFKRPEGHYAGTLIEQCGLKGRRVGGAAVSEKHAGFIVNLGDATCADVLGLISLIQETVLKETGITLECEVRKIG